MTSTSSRAGGKAAEECLAPLLPFEVAGTDELQTSERSASAPSARTAESAFTTDRAIPAIDVAPTDAGIATDGIEVTADGCIESHTPTHLASSLYRQAVAQALELGRVAQGTKGEAEMKKATHEDALVTVIQLGRSLHRSLRDIAKDTGASPGQLCRLENCHALLTRTQPIWADLGTAERRERLTVSRLRHLLPAEPAVQRRGMEMLAAKSCTESEVRDFVRAEIEAARPRAPKEHVAVPRWLVSLIRSQQLRRADILDKDTISSGHVVVRLEVDLPMSRAALERVLPRGNTHGSRRAAA